MRQDPRVGAWDHIAVTTQDATLIAAGVAAISSLAKLVADALSARGTASRAAHRTVLEPHLGGLATSIHEVVAGAVLIHKRAQEGQAPGQAGENSHRATANLKALRLEVKYPLPGPRGATEDVDAGTGLGRDLQRGPLRRRSDSTP